MKEAKKEGRHTMMKIASTNTQERVPVLEVLPKPPTTSSETGKETAVADSQTRFALVIRRLINKSINVVLIWIKSYWGCEAINTLLKRNSNFSMCTCVSGGSRVSQQQDQEGSWGNAWAPPFALVLACGHWAQSPS